MKKRDYSQAAEAHLQAAQILCALESQVGSNSSCATSLKAQAHFHEHQAHLTNIVKFVTNIFTPILSLPLKSWIIF